MVDQAVNYEINGEKYKAHASWYRGDNCNFGPVKKNLKTKNSVDRYILYGWVPTAPIINKKTPICAFGSCFAGNVTKYLDYRGYNVLTAKTRHGSGCNSYIVRCGEGMVNTSVIKQQFEWALEEKKFDDSLWYDKEKNLVEYNELVREATKSIFFESELFIITLGLSEVWYNKNSGEAFWRTIPENYYDSSKHGFKVLSPQENFDNLDQIYKLIRKHRGENAKLLFTLSPVPLVATFRPVSCVTANSVSKASLRYAIDQLVNSYDSDKNLFYFPSYEIVMNLFSDPFLPDNRHPRPKVIATIMDSFERNYSTDYSGQCINEYVGYLRGGKRSVYDVEKN